ncbi:30S ribosomal protein S4 [Candidatus Vidania fulgoroideorum]
MKIKRGKICRREGINLFLFSNTKNLNKKIKINTEKNIKIDSEFKILLRKKQKIKIIYGLKNKQFKKYLKKNKIIDFVSIKKIINILESRFDSILYRSGLCSTRLQARKMIIHNHFEINNKKNNFPSIVIKVNDKISLKKKSKGLRNLLLKNLKNNKNNKDNFKIDYKIPGFIFIKRIKLDESDLFNLI